jgi:hypothetical protein
MLGCHDLGASVNAATSAKVDHKTGREKEKEQTKDRQNTTPYKENIPIVVC